MILWLSLQLVLGAAFAGEAPVRLQELVSRLQLSPAAKAPAVPEPAKLQILASRAGVSLPSPSAPNAPARLLAAVHGSLAAFSPAELESMPLERLDDLAGAVLDGRRAVPSEAAPVAAAPARSIYLLSKPLRSDARLGWKAKSLHYGLETAWCATRVLGGLYMLNHFGLPYLAHVPILRHAVGFIAHWGPWTWAAVEIAKSIAAIPVQSRIDLEIRSWIQKMRQLKRLAGIPGIKAFHVMTAYDPQYRRLIAARQEARNVVVLETDRPLEDLGPDFPRPFLVHDQDAAHVRFTLTVDGRPIEPAWTPTLREVLERQPLDTEVAGAWRRSLEERGGGFARLRKPKIRIVAALVEDGQVFPLQGSVAAGDGVKKIVGLAFWRRSPRAIPVSKTVVVPREPFSFRHWLARLLGRRISL